MAVLKTDDNKELIITCECGCDDSIHFCVSEDEETYNYYAIMSYMNGNFYKDQYGMFGVLKEKLKKIWAIIRNKDYYYSDVVMNGEDFKRFKEYINQFGE